MVTEIYLFFLLENLSTMFTSWIFQIVNFWNRWMSSLFFIVAVLSPCNQLVVRDMLKIVFYTAREIMELVLENIKPSLMLQLGFMEIKIEWFQIFSSF